MFRYAVGERASNELLEPSIEAAARRVSKDIMKLQTVPRAGKGGIEPVLKGQSGVERAIEAVRTRGEKILGREITIDTTAGRTRIDLLVETPNGKLRFIEVKTGPSARLTPNQRATFSEIRSEGGIPRGKRSADADLTPGRPIGPTEVVIERF